MKLVDDVRHAWRWFSVQAMALGMIGIAAWNAIPDDLRASVPGWLAHWAVMTLFGLGIVGRLVKQEHKP